MPISAPVPTADINGSHVYVCLARVRVPGRAQRDRVLYRAAGLVHHRRPPDRSVADRSQRRGHARPRPCPPRTVSCSAITVRCRFPNDLDAPRSWSPVVPASSARTTSARCSAPDGRRRTSQITVLDKLTYAGNPANLDAVRGSDRLRVRAGRHLRRRAGRQARRRARRGRALRGRVARGPVDPRRRPSSSSTNVVGTQTLLDAALRHGVGPVRARVDRRGVRLDRRGLLAGDRSARAQLARTPRPRRPAT